jgi:hypothetical protein
MENFDLFWSYPHGDHVDPVFDPGAPKPGHPHQRRPPQLLEFIEVDRACRSAKAEVGSCFYFNERDRLPPLSDQVQVPMPAPEPMLENAPISPAQPPGCDAFAEKAEGLGFGEHVARYGSRRASLSSLRLGAADAVEVLEAGEYLAGLGRLGGVSGAEDAGVFQLVDDAGGAAVADL